MEAQAAGYLRKVDRREYKKCERSCTMSIIMVRTVEASNHLARETSPERGT